MNISWFGKLLNSGRIVGPAISLLLLLGFVSMAYGGSASNAVNAICTLYLAVKSVIFILGLVLIILGGAMYAGAHVLPGSTKGSVQGYGMGMILGGVIGVIIAVSASYILTVITGNSNISAACGAS
ncbi:MAG: hypothetical protein M1360_00865 [Candidatus Marsarchaeota archaeon]|jgi:hypothetical protein|nr:hypothetical protein [Candidatus Marsarchaeota archaeon]MCL5418477.1 hypothetical protein [Candidatus Marsarchaeota archaeon]